MSFYEALKLAFASILSHKLRSFLTLLGVIFGVATVIVVVSLIEGFNAYVDEKIANIGTNAFSVQRFSIEDFSSVEALNAARRRNKDVGPDDLRVTADDPFDLGRAVARLEVALWGEGLRAESTSPSGGREILLRMTPRND